MKLLKHPITSLVFGIIIGVFIVMKAPVPSEFDSKPYRDSIKVLKAEKAKERAEGNSHIQKADSAEKSVVERKPKLKHDIQAIEAFTYDSRTRFLDSIDEITNRGHE